MERRVMSIEEKAIEYRTMHRGREQPQDLLAVTVSSSTNALASARCGNKEHS